MEPAAAQDSASKKRKSAPADGTKQPKKRKEWQVPRKGLAQGKTIEPGDAGIFITCNRKQEAKCVMEVKGLFEEHAEKIFGSSVVEKDKENDDVELDIEAEIGAELKDLQKPKKAPLFTNIRLDVVCVCFVRTIAPIEPVSFVEGLCKEAAANNVRRSKWARRLTPMSCMAKATESGLRDAAKTALGPIFHAAGATAKKFAIRPSIRNHHVLTRDTIIRLVASMVGPGHSVDLNEPDVWILVEVYTNICGVAVVGTEFETLKRFNLAEIQVPEIAAGETAAMPSADHAA